MRDFQAADDDTGWDVTIVDLLARAHRAQPDELASTINVSTRPLGVDITIYLIDHEQERLWALPERGRPAVTYVDSTAVAMLITSDDFTRGRGARLRLAGAGAQLIRLLETTNLDRMLDVYDDVTAALTSGTE